MKKRIFGIKIGTILTAFVCLVVAFIIWMLVKYDSNTVKAAVSVQGLLLRG